MPWVGLNIFFHLEHTNKEKKKQGRRGIIQGASPQAACLMCWQSALVQGDASLSREESRDGVCLQLASRTVLRGDGREEQGPPGRKRCGREPLHTFNTVVLNKRERRTKAVIISRALPTLARERVCLVYTQGFAFTLLSMTSVSGSWTAPCAVQQGLAARPPHGSAHLLTLPPHPPRRHRPRGSHESVLCACRGGFDVSD